MGELIRSYLLEHPEMLREMAEKLEANEKVAEESQREKALVSFKDDVFKNANDPQVGNPKGDVTIVEFMDYNCGWCKKAMREMTTLVENDKNVRVVFKEFPIFGEHSEYAARAALAAAKQGKYWELHQALFSQEGQVTKDVVDQLAEANGIDIAKMKADIEVERDWRTDCRQHGAWQKPRHQRHTSIHRRCQGLRRLLAVGRFELRHCRSARQRLQDVLTPQPRRIIHRF